MIRIQSLEWPKEASEVECLGFSDAILFTIADAAMRNTVDVVSYDVNGYYHHYTIDFLGFRYHLEAEEFPTDTGLRCVPYRLEKIAKIGCDDDGENFVIEDYPLAAAQFKKPIRYEGIWGSF